MPADNSIHHLCSSLLHALHIIPTPTSTLHAPSPAIVRCIHPSIYLARTNTHTPAEIIASAEWCGGSARVRPLRDCAACQDRSNTRLPPPSPAFVRRWLPRAPCWRRVRALPPEPSTNVRTRYRLSLIRVRIVDARTRTDARIERSAGSHALARARARSRAYCFEHNKMLCARLARERSRPYPSR